MKKLITLLALTITTSSALASGTFSYNHCDELKYLQHGTASHFDIPPACVNRSGTYKASINTSNHSVNITATMENHFPCYGTMHVKITACDENTGALIGTVSLNDAAATQLQNSSIQAYPNERYAGHVHINFEDSTGALLGFDAIFSAPS